MNNPRERYDDLMADRATQDLGASQADELQLLLTLHPEWEHDESLELAAAALHVALLRRLEPMPIEVRERLSRNARRWPHGA